jgi:DNA-binding NarL/FixJ family response regulator
MFKPTRTPRGDIVMRILIVEDDAGFAAILRECLEDDGEFSVVELLENEEDTINFVEAGKLANVDCMLLDLQLPRSRADRTIVNSAGLNIACLIRSSFNFWGTIIVLTNSRSLTDGERALAAGCDGFMCKHMRLNHVPDMVVQLKAGLRGDITLVSSEMRYVFVRSEISPKEACLMSMLSMGMHWDEIARRLGYKNAKAAANIADRVFDKLLTPQTRKQMDMDGIKKRQRALEIWRSRNRTGMLMP